METRIKPKTSKPKTKKPATAKTTKKVNQGYNRFKDYDGKQYTGMQVGRSHHWNYEAGDWKETKITPDLWEVGTGYQWYIIANQKVVKLNANDYSTEMSGLKFKPAANYCHRRRRW